MKASEKTPKTPGPKVSAPKGPRAKSTTSGNATGAKPRSKPAAARKAPAGSVGQAPARKADPPRREFAQIRPVESLRTLWVVLCSLVGLDTVLLLVVLLR